MNRRLYLTCLWPGLPELWWRGRLSALPTAIAFTAAVNFLLVAALVYPEWLAPILVRMAGWIGVGVWLFYVLRSARDMPALLNPRKATDRPDHFPEAHRAYLSGQWALAESLLSDTLAVDHRDPPALLLLAGVYRQTDRFDAAGRVLEEVRRTEAADRWWIEAAAEERRLERDRRYRVQAAEPEDDSSPRAAADSRADTDSRPDPTEAAAKVSHSPDRPLSDAGGEIFGETAAGAIHSKAA